MSKVLAPIFVAIAMIGVLSVVFAPSSKTRRESRANQDQRLFDVGFECGVASTLAVLQDKVAADPFEITLRAGAWWNTKVPNTTWKYGMTGSGAYVTNVTVSSTNREAAPIDWTNMAVKFWSSLSVTNFTHPTTNVVVGYDAAIIDSIVKDGTFCRVRGHSWGAHMHVTLEHAPGRVGCRKCQVCGLHQEQYASEWK